MAPHWEAPLTMLLSRSSKHYTAVFDLSSIIQFSIWSELLPKQKLKPSPVLDGAIYLGVSWFSCLKNVLSAAFSFVNTQNITERK